MPRKSTAPYKGPPSWLDPDAERSLVASAAYTKPAFIRACMEGLLAVGCSPWQAAQVAANAMGEAAWGAKCYHANPYGWKITQAFADAHKARTEQPAAWWKARGNVDSADSAWCFYRAFDSLSGSLGEWVANFVPHPDRAAPMTRYVATGRAFWRNDPRWFEELIRAGYKGAPSKDLLRDIYANRKPGPHPSVKAHEWIANEVLEVWAQWCLGIDPDGAWGPKSIAAMRAWQTAKGLPVTGKVDAATIPTLLAVKTP